MAQILICTTIERVITVRMFFQPLTLKILTFFREISMYFHDHFCYLHAFELVVIIKILVGGWRNVSSALPRILKLSFLTLFLYKYLACN